METKRARKELAAFSNHRRTCGSASKASQNNLVDAGNDDSCLVMGTSNAWDKNRGKSSNNNHNNERDTNDNNGDRIGNTASHQQLVDVPPVNTSPSNLERPSFLNFHLDLASERPRAEMGEIVVMHGSPLSPSLLSSIQTPLSGSAQNQRSQARSSQPRLSRARLRMTDDERMMVTIATDDEDKSTSSTDVDPSTLLAPSSPASRSASVSPSRAHSALYRHKPQQKKKKKTKKSRANHASKAKKTPAYCKSLSNSPSSGDVSDKDLSPPSDERSQLGIKQPCDKFNNIDKEFRSNSFKRKRQHIENEEVISRETDSFLDNQALQSLCQHEDDKHVLCDTIQIDLDSVSIPMVDTISVAEKGYKNNEYGDINEKNENETFIDFEERTDESDSADLKQSFNRNALSFVNNEGNMNGNPVLAPSRDGDCIEVSTSTTIMKNTPSSVINGKKRSEENSVTGTSNFDLDSNVKQSEIDVLICDKNKDNSTHPVLTFCSSLRDNGYLADTEHQTTSGVSFFRHPRNVTGSNSTPCPRKLPRKKSKLSHFLSKFEDIDDEEYNDDGDDVSLDSWLEDGPSQSRSTTIQTIASPELAPLSPPGQDGDGVSSSTRFLPGVGASCRQRSLTPLGLFRIRQSGLVQRSVTLTYLLTFLYLFACLLQLYTAFGVYGVLSSTKVPAPWPWFAFHTIYR